MARTKYPDDDLFSRAELLRQRFPENHRNIRHEADAATGEDLLHALVAAAAIISHADGHMSLAERRRLIATFAKTAPLSGFSVDDLAEGLALHLRAYAHDPVAAESQALLSLRTTELANNEKQLIIRMCEAVLAADGIAHPAELGALDAIRMALNMPEVRS